MIHRILRAAPLAAVLLALTPAGLRAEISLIGVGQVPAQATDLSHLTDALDDSTPHNRLGSFGSAIAYTGEGNRYIAVADRGPSDGAVSFKDRFHTFDIGIAPGKSPSVEVKLVGTTMLTNEAGQPLLGISSAFDATNSPRGLRLDPEGVRISGTGTLFICDEYGPFVAEFGLDGRRVRNLAVPSEFSVKHPAADKEREIAGNATGRVTNKGFEGLAIAPDGRTLYAILQGPLLQDGGKRGSQCRLLRIDVKTGATAQFLYPLDQASNGLNEILAWNDHEFLVIERDGQRGAKAKVKHIVRIDITGATDISSMASLPATGVPAGVTPVRKRPFIDLLDKRWGLASDHFPEKVEGLTFGPNLPDGRRVLVVTTDNDFKPDSPSWFYVFAFSDTDLNAAP